MKGLACTICARCHGPDGSSICVNLNSLLRYFLKKNCFRNLHHNVATFFIACQQSSEFLEDSNLINNLKRAYVWGFFSKLCFSSQISYFMLNFLFNVAMIMTLLIVLGAIHISKYAAAVCVCICICFFIVSAEWKCRL